MPAIDETARIEHLMEPEVAEIPDGLFERVLDRVFVAPDGGSDAADLVPLPDVPDRDGFSAAAAFDYGWEVGGWDPVDDLAIDELDAFGHDR